MSLAYTQNLIMSKWNYVFRNIYKFIKNEKLKCLESTKFEYVIFIVFVMASLNKFRRKKLLKNSHNKLHGLTYSVFNKGV